MSTNNPTNNSSTQSLVSLRGSCESDHYQQQHYLLGTGITHPTVGYRVMSSSPSNNDNDKDYGKDRTFSFNIDHLVVASDVNTDTFRPQVVVPFLSSLVPTNNTFNTTTYSQQHQQQVLKKRTRAESSNFNGNVLCGEGYFESMIDGGNNGDENKDLTTPLDSRQQASSIFKVVASKQLQHVKRIKPSHRDEESHLSCMTSRTVVVPDYHTKLENCAIVENCTGNTNTSTSCAPPIIESFQLPGEIIEIIFSFMEDSSRSVAEQVSIDFHKACLQVEKRDLIRLWNIENSCLLKPLNEDSVSPILITQAERRFNCILPFHLKVFLVELSDGRASWHNDFLHISNMLSPLSEWKDVGELIKIGETIGPCCTLLLLRKYDGSLWFKPPSSKSIATKVNFKNWVQMKMKKFYHVHYNIGSILERTSQLPYSFHAFTTIPSCCNFKPIVKAMVNHRGTLFQFATEDLKDDEEVALCAIAEYPPAFHHCSVALKDNENIAKLAVSKDGKLLQFISARLKNNFEIVEKAISQNPMSLQHASLELKSNPTLVFLAATSCCDVFENALQFSGLDLRSNRQFMEKVLRIRGNCLKYASDSLKGDVELVSIAVQQKGTAIQYAVPSLRKDFGIIYEAVVQDARSIKYIPESTKSQRQFILDIIELNAKALEFVPDQFRGDREVVLNGKLLFPKDPS